MDHRRRLQAAYNQPPPLNFNVIHGIERSLNALPEGEDLYLKQRSQEDWIRWGDRITGWFHCRASDRRRTNTITAISDSSGMWHTDLDEVKGIFVDYFKNIFTLFDPANAEFRG